MTTMARPSLSVANAARRAANEQRAVALASVATGMSSVADIFTEACLPSGKALLRIPLVRLLSAQDGVSKNKARQVIRKTHELLELDYDDAQEGRITVMWLLDARAAGKRMLAFADAVHQDTTAPWYGFPYAPQTAPAVQAKGA